MLQKQSMNTFLITGGTGSFGKTMLRKLLSSFYFEIQEIRVLSRDEKKQDDLRKEINDNRVKFYLGDVRDYTAVREAVRGVDYVFHAAALKQVPSCDFFPLEAVKTNILGASNVLMACKETPSVKKVVVLSTDKAVYPVNAMGMSKAMMEKVMVAESRNCAKGQVFCGTRYGNVIASRGSVIPLFINQIVNNREITLTEPNMTRFLMSLDEAIELVLYAFRHGQNGDIYVQKSPAATVDTIARAVVRLVGLTEEQVQIKVMGARHGEKLHETLVSQEDMPTVEDLPNYYKIPADNRNLDYAKAASGTRLLDTAKTYASDTDTPMTVEETVELLKKNAEVQAALRESGIYV